MPEMLLSTTGAVKEPQTPLSTVQTFAVVAIGASVGGLLACKKFLTALPADSGMAFVFVQHLEPTHDSMLVELLADHAPIPLLEASDGMQLQPNHVYVISPGSNLAVVNGVLQVTRLEKQPGSRLSFDFLLKSLALDCGPRVICIVLTGTGSDGSVGLLAVKANGGFVIAQDPAEAAADGMPRSAIATGRVDLVLPVADIPAAIVKHVHSHDAPEARMVPDAPEPLTKIIALLLQQTGNDFTPYKHGTLLRRIDRRMSMASLKSHDLLPYLHVLETDTAELEQLGKDLLIHVTSFFRDAATFEHLASEIIPPLIKERKTSQPLRIWVAGCSTGEEAYSLAMLFLEAKAAAASDVKIQIFASDLEEDAIATAREGFYPATAASGVPSELLSRYFTPDDGGFRVVPALREMVVFTVHDVLSDPPFSKLDLISCRNLLIYLSAAAQVKVITRFHFALNLSGLLLLGSAETVTGGETKFSLISKSIRLYRSSGRSKQTDKASLGELLSVTPATSLMTASSRRNATLNELCQQKLVDAYAPASVLVNATDECLFFLGPTEKFLNVPKGSPSSDLFAMLQADVRPQARRALQTARQSNEPASAMATHTFVDGTIGQIAIRVLPLSVESEQLMLVCLDAAAAPALTDALQVSDSETPRISQLEQQLLAAHNELDATVLVMEASSEEHRSMAEEAMSTKEEFQAANEELLTSKEELQSLNEELTALNGQIQESLEKQRTTSNDLQNVLNSTNVATLFLDRDLNIRFFTPVTRKLFNVIPSDVGRPLADLNSLATDDALLAGSRSVLKTLTPLEREIQTRDATWHSRRILPYRTEQGEIEGVVITFVDITERKRVSDDLKSAKQLAQTASLAKTRFLASASHDLRQPLQSLSLIQGMLGNIVKDPQGQKLVGKLENIVETMSGMLNTLLDINQIESGTMHAELSVFAVNDVLTGLKGEFAETALAQQLSLRVVKSGHFIESDPRLLQQMARNLLSNAMKYTGKGKVLLGCRRRGKVLSLEVWDTGKGIPEAELEAIFEEYHQLDNTARERSLGLGLGLSIVRRMGILLGHRVTVQSKLGRGSVFAIEVPMARSPVPPAIKPQAHAVTAIAQLRPGKVSILVIEDEPDLRELLELHLRGEGHTVVTARTGKRAIDQVQLGGFRPDVILTDFSLPEGMNGLEAKSRLWDILGQEVPVIVLTGAISTVILRDIALHKCTRLNKPVKLSELSATIQRLLPHARLHQPTHSDSATPQGPLVYVVDDDRMILESMRGILEQAGKTVQCFDTAEAFLSDFKPKQEACLLVDAGLPGMSGHDLIAKLKAAGQSMPCIMITGNSDVQMAVDAMKSGAINFIEKPFNQEALLIAVAHAMELAHDHEKHAEQQVEAQRHMADLTPRQREIMDMVLAGHPSKNIAADLGISQRTVENHRASIMKRTGAKSLPALARLAVVAASPPSKTAA